MKKIWITYCWKDNENNDVEFMAQQLETQGFEVKLDRWEISAGKRLWEQIDNFITNKSESDAWIFYATQNSLGSEPCKEEYAYALDRALSDRGNNYAVIAVFPSSVEKELIPAGIKTRLFVSLEDNDWLARISASVKGEKPNISRKSLDPFVVNMHSVENQQYKFVFEVRPRAGVWSQTFIAIPNSEVEKTRWIMPVTAKVAGSGRVPMFNNFSNLHVQQSDDKKWCMCIADDDASPSKSIYLYLSGKPSSIAFGSSIESSQKFVVDLN
ncbi:toll/interleukin-1 receptor domain-containing protein [Shewanella baltica]|uniref:toll/interleukin-1 receptor domain-containing protein n=1 Tax=Shewanella baltica TaxID=62322 RepID=UPI003D797B46